MKPIAIKTRPSLDRRLGIKSSLSKPKALIASLILIWFATKSHSIIYGKQISAMPTSLEVDESLLSSIETFLNNAPPSIKQNILQKLPASPLFITQLEPLQVACELVWKLCSVKFVDSTLANSTERTGGKRYSKKIDFAITIDQIESFLVDNSGAVYPETFSLISKWLDDETTGYEIENKLLSFLTFVSEDTHYKIKTNPIELEFLQEGIYSALISGQTVEFGSEEKVGPTRILSSAISSGLNSYLKESGGEISSLRPIDELRSYLARVEKYLDLTKRIQKITIESEIPGAVTVSRSPENPYPHNLLVYGAPGTGKSHYLNEISTAVGFKEVTRVTFYTDYSYGMFVGALKPKPIYGGEPKNFKNINSAVETRPGDPIIEYSFNPGPFLVLLEKAFNDPTQNYLLIIEELNRADAAAVFGDVFQLLDRDSNGASKYSISLTKEATEYLISRGVGPEVRIPGNLYIWATMNNADQGVYALDSAFKRRWSYHYIHLNENQSEISSLSFETKFKDSNSSKLTLNWNELRTKINKKLSEIGIHEDQQIGPFFLSNKELNDDKAFKYKLLSYLKDDILRHRADEFFKIPSATLSDLLAAYESGNDIFDFELI